MYCLFVASGVLAELLQQVQRRHIHSSLPSSSALRLTNYDDSSVTVIGDSSGKLLSHILMSFK